MFTLSASATVAAAAGRRPGVATRGDRACFLQSGRCRATRGMRVRASAAAEGDGFVEVFPRTKERDPYRRLGISSEATYEEVQDARNYLVEQYKSHTAGVEAIEQAFDRIIQQKLKARKKAKGLTLKKQKKGEDYTPPFVERVKNAFQRPDNKTIVRRLVLYALISAWAVVQSSTSGPAFQVAVAFGFCVFFLNDKRGGKAVPKSFLHSFIALLIGWFIGSLVPVYFPVFPQMMSPELILSLFSFISFFVTCTFLK